MKTTTNNLGNMLNPKHIIFDAVSSKLKGTGIIKIVLVFNVITEKYNVMFSTGEDKAIKFEVQQDEIRMLKKVLINKILSRAQSEISAKIKAVIISMNLPQETFEVFIQDERDNVTKFDY
jgi:hypothetical protein